MSMQKIINITLKATAAILAMYMAAACVFEKEIPMTRGNERQHVAVQLGIGAEGMTQTKADDNSGTAITTPDAENPVQSLETTIKTLRIYAYTKEGANFVLCGYYQAFAKEDGTFNTTGHVMDLNLPASGTVDVYFRAVANESAMLPGEGKEGTIEDNYAISVGRDSQTGGLTFPNAIGFDELNSILYSVDQKFENGMPMYADQKVSINVDNVGNANTGDHEGHFILQEAVNLTLTRSLAKIEVYAAEAAAETTGKEATTTTSVTITGVSLANVPASGNLFTAPAANATLTYTDFNGESGGTGYSTSFLKDEADIVTVNKKVSETATADIQNPDNYTLVSNAYYLAENNQGAPSTFEYGANEYPVVVTDADNEEEIEAAATVLKIDYKVGGTEKTGYVKMPQIKRNTWYKVLARIQANGEIALVFVVKPWNVDITELTYSDVISITTKATWSFEDNNNASFDESEGEVSLRTKTDSYFTFQIDQPADAKWTATLIPISGQLDSFKFIDENDSEVSTVTGDVGTLKTLTIRPTGSPDAENNVASLRITIKTKEGNTKFVTPSELLKNSDVSYKEFTIIHSN